MARIKAGVFGNAYSGKAGNMVFSTLKGEQIVRAYQPNVENPRTPLQSAQRDRFTLVVSSAKSVRADLGKMYGTGKLQNFGAITKTFLSSPMVKGYLGLTNKLTGSANAVVFGKDELKNTGNLIEAYSATGMNIFQGGVTLKLGGVQTLTEGKQQNGIQVLQLKNGEWTDLDNAPGTLYFGCDYKLGSNVSFACVFRGVNDTLVTTRPFIQVLEAGDYGLDGIQAVAQSTPLGYRKRGFYTTADACGSGWNYVYKCTYAPTFVNDNGDTAANEQHAIFVKDGKRISGYLPSLSFIAYTSNIESDPAIVPIHAETFIDFENAIIQ